MAMGSYFIWSLVFIMLGLAGLLSLVRLARGPHLLDRLVAFDVFTFTAMGFTIALGIRMREPWFLDISLVWAIIAFLTTLAFVHFLTEEKKEDDS